MDEMDRATLERLRYLMDGNGRPGLVQQHERMYRDMYNNPETGEQGIFADVREMKNRLRDMAGWIKGAAAAVALGALSGTAVAVKTFFGL